MLDSPMNDFNTNSIVTHQGRLSPVAIAYDARYKQTLAKDERRQNARRWARRIGCQYEKSIVIPRWKKLAQNASKQKLSVCIITMNSAGRIRPLLDYLRSYVDEIVVGIDSKTTDNTWGICGGLVDELFTVENPSATCNGGLEAIVARCHGDWILRLDDDEYPEPSLWQYIQGIMATKRYTHYKLPRLHLSSRNPLQWIDDGYLYPDYQMRLFRNTPNAIHFPGAIGHLGITCDGPKGRLNTINLIHLNLAMNPRSKREAKLKSYVERLAGSWVHPINERALLFEDYPYQMRLYDYDDATFREILSQALENITQSSRPTSLKKRYYQEAMTATPE